MVFLDGCKYCKGYDCYGLANEKVCYSCTRTKVKDVMEACVHGTRVRVIINHPDLGRLPILNIESRTSRLPNHEALLNAVRRAFTDMGKSHTLTPKPAAVDGHSLRDLGLFILELSNNEATLRFKRCEAPFQKTSKRRRRGQASTSQVEEVDDEEEGQSSRVEELDDEDVVEVEPTLEVSRRMTRSKTGASGSATGGVRTPARSNASTSPVVAGSRSSSGRLASVASDSGSPVVVATQTKGDRPDLSPAQLRALRPNLTLDLNTMAPIAPGMTASWSGSSSMRGPPSTAPTEMSTRFASPVGSGGLPALPLPGASGASRRPSAPSGSSVSAGWRSLQPTGSVPSLGSAGSFMRTGTMQFPAGTSSSPAEDQWTPVVQARIREQSPTPFESLPLREQRLQQELERLQAEYDALGQAITTRSNHAEMLRFSRIVSETSPDFENESRAFGAAASGLGSGQKRRASDTAPMLQAKRSRDSEEGGEDEFEDEEEEDAKE